MPFTPRRNNAAYRMRARLLHFSSLKLKSFQAQSKIAKVLCFFLSRKKILLF
jgi:hypothetical protein